MLPLPIFEYHKPRTLAEATGLLASLGDKAMILAGGTDVQVRALYDYGDALGIAFQIVDDILDYSGATETIGKNVGDDFRERKLTLPVIKAVARADADERAFWQRTIEKGDQQEGDLDRAMAILGRHGAIDAARADALAWAARGRSALASLPEGEIRELLAKLADFVVARVA